MSRTKTAKGGPPEPPQPPRRLRITREQVAGIALLASAISAGLAAEPRRVLEVMGCVAVIYVFLMAAFRLLGKRELSAMSPLELITLMIIPEIASGTLNGEAPLLQALAGIAALLTLVFVVSALSARWKPIERMMEAQPQVLVDNGRLCEEALAQERITTDELYAEMRKHGLHELEQLRWAVLESGGEISFVPKAQPALEAPHRNRNA